MHERESIVGDQYAKNDDVTHTYMLSQKGHEFASVSMHAIYWNGQPLYFFRETAGPFVAWLAEKKLQNRDYIPSAANQNDPLNRLCRLTTLDVENRNVSGRKNPDK